jgi:hypothetical protein
LIYQEREAGTVLFPVTIKSIRIGNWKKSSGVAIKDRHKACVIAAPHRSPTKTTGDRDV